MLSILLYIIICSAEMSLKYLSYFYQSDVAFWCSFFAHLVCYSHHDKRLITMWHVIVK